jgi:transposase
VAQERTPAEVRAEASSDETKQFVRRVRRVTRRKFTPEEKVRIVLEGFRGEVKVSELCRREGIRPNVYYAWLKDFMEAGKTRLRADTVRDATQVEVEGLKQLVAELSLTNLVLKKTAVPEFD